MRCDKCNKNEASVRVDAELGDQRLSLSLCAQCAAGVLKQDSDGQVVDLAKILGDFAQGALHAAHGATEIAPEDDRCCPGCGLARSALRRRGRAGCETCYSEFAEDLAEWIEGLHRGNTHCGLGPAAATSKAHPWTANRDLLRIQLERAVSDEAFERAAALRDALRGIEEKQERE